MITVYADIGQLHQLSSAAHDGSAELFRALAGFGVHTSHKSNAHHHIHITHHLTIQHRIQVSNVKRGRVGHIASARETYIFDGRRLNIRRREPIGLGIERNTNALREKHFLQSVLITGRPATRTQGGGSLFHLNLVATIPTRLAQFGLFGSGQVEFTEHLLERLHQLLGKEVRLPLSPQSSCVEIYGVREKKRRFAVLFHPIQRR